MSNNAAMSVIAEPQQNNVNVKTKPFIHTWLIWVGGLVVSCVPIILIILSKKVQDTTYSNYWNDFLCNSDIFYICVSCAVAAFFEFFSNSKGKIHTISLVVMILLIVDVLICVGLYSYLMIESEVHNVDYTANIGGISRLFLILTFLLGTLSFVNFKER